MRLAVFILVAASVPVDDDPPMASLLSGKATMLAGKKPLTMATLLTAGSSVSRQGTRLDAGVSQLESFGSETAGPELPQDGAFSKMTLVEKQHLCGETVRGTGVSDFNHTTTLSAKCMGAVRAESQKPEAQEEASVLCETLAEHLLAQAKAHPAFNAEPLTKFGLCLDVATKLGGVGNATEINRKLAEGDVMGMCTRSAGRALKTVKTMDDALALAGRVRPLCEDEGQAAAAGDVWAAGSVRRVCQRLDSQLSSAIVAGFTGTDLSLRHESRRQFCQRFVRQAQPGAAPLPTMEALDKVLARVAKREVQAALTVHGEASGDPVLQGVSRSPALVTACSVLTSKLNSTAPDTLYAGRSKALFFSEHDHAQISACTKKVRALALTEFLRVRSTSGVALLSHSVQTATAEQDLADQVTNAVMEEMDAPWTSGICLDMALGFLDARGTLRSKSFCSNYGLEMVSGPTGVQLSQHKAVHKKAPKVQRRTEDAAAAALGDTTSQTGNAVWGVVHGVTKKAGWGGGGRLVTSPLLSTLGIT
eukprot:CAMPEP_0204381926 /NCGR_PEP_ID=MMETSP0469-20131031/54669_1 /ASSEMBLY_ACC=CAM_ASM_000384 /TAXON_ID=2969 /ORGANISM="Oxyrrhis marina" /LENGTH=533 /DNA_ID=CAMNT_0051373881 /DNA_START=75 /DNA_END=1674 /DNA_ORIENTATION=-